MPIRQQPQRLDVDTSRLYRYDETTEVWLLKHNDGMEQRRAVQVGTVQGRKVWNPVTLDTNEPIKYRIYTTYAQGVEGDSIYLSKLDALWALRGRLYAQEQELGARRAAIEEQIVAEGGRVPL